MSRLADRADQNSSPGSRRRRSSGGHSARPLRAWPAQPWRRRSRRPPSSAGRDFISGRISAPAFRSIAASGCKRAADLSSSAFDLYPESGERAGVSFGAQAGYNWQIGPWVYGVETDFNFLDGRRGPSGTFAAPPAYWSQGVFSYTLAYEQSAKYFASLRGRLGFALDRTLFYVTAGVAAGGSRGPATLFLNTGGPGNPFTTPDSQSSRMKYILGAGVEYALYDNWSARLEYFFLNQSLNTHVFDNGSGFQYGSRIRNENHVLRFGLNYNFGKSAEAADEKGAKKDDKKGEDAKPESEAYSVHGQTTGVLQGYPKFPALYSGPNSFPPNGQARFGSTTNLFLGLRLWEGAAAYLNPEIDEGLRPRQFGRRRRLS